MTNLGLKSKKNEKITTLQPGNTFCATCEEDGDVLRCSFCPLVSFFYAALSQKHHLKFILIAPPGVSCPLSVTPKVHSCSCNCLKKITYFLFPLSRKTSAENWVCPACLCRAGCTVSSMVNHDCCSHCDKDGNLICCDSCPRVTLLY